MILDQETKDQEIAEIEAEIKALEIKGANLVSTINRLQDMLRKMEARVNCKHSLIAELRLEGDRIAE